jgi:DNA replication protein DnaC
MVVFEGKVPRLKDLLVDSRIRSRISKSHLKEYLSILEVCKTFVSAADFSPPGKGLFFYGPNGGGKSWVAAAVANEISSRTKCEALRRSVPEILFQYFKTWEIDEQLMYAPVLVLEEIGKEIRTKNEHAEKQIEFILKYRFEEGKITIITANVTAQEITDIYGGTVASIFYGRCFPIEFPDVDLRILQNQDFQKRILKGD